MKLSRERIAGLSRLLVDKLAAGGMIEPGRDRQALVISLERVITDELSVEDRLNAEVKAMMRQYEAEIARGHLNEHQLFQMIKKQLVKDRGVIL
jgi:hypothetical protein